MASKLSKKVYQFGEKRTVKLGKDVVVISDDEKNISIPLPRWISFLRQTNDIEQSLQKLAASEFVKYKQHIGGGWYVSVTTGYQCVDIRRFYMPLFGFEEKATKEGFAIRVREWSAFGDAVRQLHASNPQLSKIQPCYEGTDHQNQESAFQCRECYPFPDASKLQ